jgi:hypothetical protein
MPTHFEVRRRPGESIGKAVAASISLGSVTSVVSPSTVTVACPTASTFCTQSAARVVASIGSVDVVGISGLSCPRRAEALVAGVDRLLGSGHKEIAAATGGGLRASGVRTLVLFVACECLLKVARMLA